MTEILTSGEAQAQIAHYAREHGLPVVEGDRAYVNALPGKGTWESVIDEACDELDKISPIRTQDEFCEEKKEEPKAEFGFGDIPTLEEELTIFIREPARIHAVELEIDDYLAGEIIKAFMKDRGEMPYEATLNHIKDVLYLIAKERTAAVDEMDILLRQRMQAVLNMTDKELRG